MSLKALLKNKTPSPCPPFWMMRQAGRHLPEFRKIRQQTPDLLKLFKSPKEIVEITLQPVERYNTDAAILFSDILMILEGLGVPLEFVPGVGPQLEPPPLSELEAWIDSKKNVDLKTTLAPVFKSLTLLKKKLSPEKTLIGFVGGPWTVSCYFLKGKEKRNYDKVLNFANDNESQLQGLVNFLTDKSIEHIDLQIKSGAEVIQVFESWASIVPKHKREAWVIEPMRKITQHIKKHHPEVGVIGFPRGWGNDLEDYITKTGVDGVSLDAGVNIASLCQKFGDKVVFQGNLQPETLVAGGEELRKEVEGVLGQFKGLPHIFNLSHGVLPETPIENVEQVIELIRK